MVGHTTNGTFTHGKPSSQSSKNVKKSAWWQWSGRMLWETLNYPLRTSWGQCQRKNALPRLPAALSECTESTATVPSVIHPTDDIRRHPSTYTLAHSHHQRRPSRPCPSHPRPSRKCGSEIWNFRVPAVDCRLVFGGYQGLGFRD